MRRSDVERTKHLIATITRVGDFVDARAFQRKIMTCATVIEVDFKARKKITSYCPEEESKLVIDLAANKRLVNDLKALLDSVVDQVDLSTTILLIPGLVDDLFVKVDGSGLHPEDIEAMGRIHQKMRASHAQS